MAEKSLTRETSILLQTLELGPDDPLVLPQAFKEALGLEEGGTCTVIQLDEMVLLISRLLVSPRALEEMRRSLDAAGVTLADLLAGLADIRSQMLRERYGLFPSP